MIKKTKYLPLTRDFVFKAVYSGGTEESKKALISMLNVILNRKENPIVDLEYKNTESTSDNIHEKKIINDIKVEVIAQTEEKERISIEMQVGHLEHFISRSIFYQAKLLTEGLDKGYEYDKIKKSIIISIVKGKLFNDTEKVHSKFLFKEAESYRTLSDVSEIHFIELDKIKFMEDKIDKMTAVDRLGAFILFTGQEDKEGKIEKLLEVGEEVISMAERLLQKASKEELLRAEEFSREMWEHDQASYRAQYRREGLAEGRAEGLEEGRAEGRKKALTEAQERIAKEMLNSGEPINKILKYTGISQEELSKIQADAQE